MWPIIINNNIWPLVFGKALSWENYLPTTTYSRGSRRWMRNFFEGTNSVSLPLEVVGELFLRPIKDSDTFLYGPGVAVTLSKERKKGAWPQLDGNSIPIKDCQHERGSLRMEGPLNWSCFRLRGSWWKGEVGGWGGQLLVVLIYWLGIKILIVSTMY